MTDIHSKAVRSKNMAAIKGRNTRPEMLVRRALHTAGFRYRLHVANLPGKPDLLFPKYKAVIFVQGCFWHQHQCAMFHWPKTRTEWWKQKISSNRAHDEAVQDKLRELGWRVLLVWECALKGKTKVPLPQLTDEIAHWLRDGSSFAELPEVVE
ncbi:MULTISPECIES: very short patch repair endonuclease [unclassified Arsukibacterium]|uniref:very short patch repair endonuclease n=1 Tax=unclassified Arsukibacterium TaxID=2635278 RepID=UPI000C3B9A04|nr:MULTISPECIES: very short patch repair endonuclease [unclassified Arsukibacterium]MAA94626.1 very short patch repair endonuclease [Rheinheimera sp.]MBM32790.1 very short patch repair endonuclease [Rheinheimera sp.]HAW93388.1 very short patch repair endonuclease [Candidatus Azambacteria bacterium]|tara:strand:+ start:38421 stop:38879 length:459 start_codon:yes stop_codon:yes gene_type:complete